MGAYVNGDLVPPVDAQSLDGVTANFGTPGAPQDGYDVTYDSNANELVLTAPVNVTVPWTSAAAPVETRPST